MSRCLGANLVRRRQLAGVPSATQRLNQLHAGEQLLRLEGNVCLLVGQQIHLRREDVKVWIQATQISGGCQLNVALRRLYRGILLLKILSENVECGEIVFHLSEGGESGLPVVCHSCIVLGLVLRTVALRRPASNRVSATDGPSDQNRLGQVNQSATLRLSRPPVAYVQNVRFNVCEVEAVGESDTAKVDREHHTA